MERLIQFSLRNRLLVSVIALVVSVAGFIGYRQLPLDAFPDVTPVLVQVFTETEGLAPEEVEKYVTYPVEVAMNGLPKIKDIRSISNFGLSVVNIYFEDGTDIYFARQLVGERLAEAREQIPEGFGEPAMGPIATGLGQILFYFVEDSTGKRTPQEMREIQDWMIKFNLQTVPGVAEVLSLGGEVKQFHVRVRPEDLLRYDLDISAVVEAIRANNSNVGAQFIVKNSEEYLVRSVGLAEKIDDLRGIVLKAEDGTPIYLEQVADIVIGGDGELRRGLATMDGRGEVVAGMVLKLIGMNSSTVIADVKARIEEISGRLPPGIRIVPYYDQATLVGNCISTMNSALLEGVVLVALVILAFMGGLRPSIVVALSIPFSMFFTFLVMRLTGMGANLMSIGGLSIAIGMMVDATIVIVENVDRWLRESDPKEPQAHVVARACREVGKPILFAIIIIVIVFTPLFTLQGVEGKTFRPLAYTVALGMFGSLLFAAVVAPMASQLLMRRPKRREGEDGAPKENIVVRGLLAGYRPLVSTLVRRPMIAVVSSVVMIVLGVVIFTRLGSEFVPRLNEGDLLVRATMAPSISLDESRDTMMRFERRLKERFPEVVRIVTRVGRGEVGAHADPVNSAEAFVGMKPQDEWQTAETPEALYAAMAEAVEDFPGVQFNFTQPIAAAVDELLTGTKAELAIKVFGPDMEVLKQKAAEIETVIRSVPGASDVQKDQVAGTPQLRITLLREAMARHGINAEDVQRTIRSAIGGETSGQLLEDVKRFDIVVRLPLEYRDSGEKIGHLVVTAPNGSRVPLDELADIEEIVGPRQITRQNNQRFMTVQCNVRGRDMGSFVKDAQAMIESSVVFPPGYLTTWGGQFELQQQANKRLALVIPVTLGVIVLLLFANFGSIKNSLLILLNIPLALVGGIVALWVSGQNLSVPASIGFIALFGIALENGMVLVSCLNQMLLDGVPLAEACIKGACQRVRAVLMTALTTAVGLVPLVMSHGVGSEVQRPLATVVLGGLVTCTLLTLLVIPSVYKWFAIDPKSRAAQME